MDAETYTITAHGGWHEVLIDAQDVPGLLALLDAGVTLRVWQDKQGKPRPILYEKCPGCGSVTLGLMKVLLGAGPKDETLCINGNALDCRRSNWSLVATGAVRVWNSRLLGVRTVRPDWTPPP